VAGLIQIGIGDERLTPAIDAGPVSIQPYPKEAGIRAGQAAGLDSSAEARASDRDAGLPLSAIRIDDDCEPVIGRRWPGLFGAVPRSAPVTNRIK
jgi:hypothetical protein